MWVFNPSEPSSVGLPWEVSPVELCGGAAQNRALAPRAVGVVPHYPYGLNPVVSRPTPLPQAAKVKGSPFIHVPFTLMLAGVG
jgi:hypothetical protein